MARVTHVKRAQQRYATVPVLDENGQPKKTPVMRGDKQRVTKAGRPVFRSATKEDRSQPLPLRKCDHCGKNIELGTAYKHITPKSGPYGGHTRFRHEDCPTWQVWEYSSSLSARTAQISYDFSLAIGNVETPDDVQGALEDAASAVRELAEEKREGAQNMEDGFGHSTSQSEELNEIADQLDSWADEIENADPPDLPEPEEQDCDECAGTGTVSSGVDEEDCEECGGSGLVVPDEPTDEQMDEWRSEVEDAVSIVDECPV